MHLRSKLSIAAALILAAGFAAYTPDTDKAEMVQKYGGSEARFAHNGNSGTIHYRDQGPKGAPAMVLIHGSNGSLHTWEGIVGRLKQNYRVLSLDLYGHGLTGPNAHDDYRASAQIGAVTAVMNSAGVEKAVFVGNSMGGWVAWRVAIGEPDRVSGLILIDAAGARSKEATKPYLGARLLQSSAGRAVVTYAFPRFLVRRSLEQNYADPARLTAERVDRYWELLRFPGNRNAAAIRATTDREDGRWSAVPTIAVPTLILWGEKDRVIPVSHAHSFNAAIKASKLIVYPDSGHLPMEEIPDAVSQDIDRWMRSLPEPPNKSA